MLQRLAGKLRRSYHRGLVGTLRHAVRRAGEALMELTPAKRRERRRRAEADRDFDTRYGVDTGGFIQLNQLAIPGSSWEFGAPYGAITPEDFKVLVDRLPIRHEEFTFVDFGSGKGRAVLLASGLPFKKVVGVELAPDLHRVARQNLEKYPAGLRRCGEVELVCGDALEYSLPDGPVVYYFYNPFGPEIMGKVAARIEESYRRTPRDIYILYAVPKQAAVWDGLKTFRKIAEAGDYAIYKAGAADGSAGG